MFKNNEWANIGKHLGIEPLAYSALIAIPNLDNKNEPKLFIFGGLDID